MNPVLGSIVVAIIVAGGSVFGQWFLKRQDYQREDERARRTEDVRIATEAVATQAAVAAQLLKEATDQAHSDRAVSLAQLDSIESVGRETHALVNDAHTKALQAEHDSVRRELVLLHEVVALRRAGGGEPGVGTLEAITVAEARAAELEATIQDRNAAAAQAATQAGTT